MDFHFWSKISVKIYPYTLHQSPLSTVSWRESWVILDPDLGFQNYISNISRTIKRTYQNSDLSHLNRRRDISSKTTAGCKSSVNINTMPYRYSGMLLVWGLQMAFQQIPISGCISFSPDCCYQEAIGIYKHWYDCNIRKKYIHSQIAKN